MSKCLNLQKTWSVCKEYQRILSWWYDTCKSTAQTSVLLDAVTIFFSYAGFIVFLPYGKNCKTALRRTHELLGPVAMYPLGHWSLDLGQKCRKWGFQKCFRCWFPEGKRSLAQCEAFAGWKHHQSIRQCVRQQTWEVCLHEPKSQRWNTCKSVETANGKSCHAFSAFNTFRNQQKHSNHGKMFACQSS